MYQLFLAVGWVTEEETTQAMIDNFNIGFINSTFVFPAWLDEQLVGCVRVLSDLHFRSIIYDFWTWLYRTMAGVWWFLLWQSAYSGGQWIYDIINDMTDVLNASQMQKLQEVLVKRLSENTVSDCLQTANVEFLDMFLTAKHAIIWIWLRHYDKERAW